MSKMSYLAAGVATAERTRALIARRGRTFSGHKLWTDEDVKVLQQCYPDYQLAMRKLGRSYGAVRARSQRLGLTPTRKHWTGEQLARLRKVYRSTASAASLREAFPDMTMKNIYKMAEYFGLRRPRRPFSPTGFLVIDQIRARCYELCLSMVDLDAMAKSGAYFTKGNWHADGLNARAIYKAVAALDGQLAAVWNDVKDVEASR